MLICTAGSAWIAFCGKLRDLFYSNRVQHYPVICKSALAFNTSDQYHQVSESHFALSVNRTMSGNQPVAGTAGVTGKAPPDNQNHDDTLHSSIQCTCASLEH